MPMTPTMKSAVKPRAVSILLSPKVTSRLLIAIALFGVGLSTVASGQTSTGRVVGFVTDPQGAAMVGAKVTVTNTATGIQEMATTDATGAYQVVDLPIGNYSVRVEIAGFRKSVTDPQQLDINQ